MKKLFFLSLLTLVLGVTSSAQTVQVYPPPPPTIRVSIEQPNAISVAWCYEPTVFGRASAEMLIVKAGGSPYRTVVSINQDFPGVTRFFEGDRLLATYDATSSIFCLFKDFEPEIYYAGR